MTGKEFKKHFERLTDFKSNPFHPLVWIVGNPKIGKNVYIGGLSEINCKDAKCVIGDNCDIASFVSINCADSHKKCIGILKNIDRKDIIIEDNVFIGTMSVILGGSHIGRNSVISAGSIIRGYIPPCSLYINGVLKDGYYSKKSKD